MLEGSLNWVDDKVSEVYHRAGKLTYALEIHAGRTQVGKLKPKTD